MILNMDSDHVLFSKRLQDVNMRNTRGLPKMLVVHNPRREWAIAVGYEAVT